MTDNKLRDLQNQFNATGTAEDEAILLLERVRIGDLEQEKLEFLFHLNYPAARIALNGHPEPEVDPVVNELVNSTKIAKLAQIWCYLGTKSAIRGLIAVMEFACDCHDIYHTEPQQSSAPLMKLVAQEFLAVHDQVRPDTHLPSVQELFPLLFPSNNLPATPYQRDKMREGDYRFQCLIAQQDGTAPPPEPDYELTNDQREEHFQAQTILHHLLTSDLFLPKAVEEVEGLHYYNDAPHDEDDFVSRVGTIVRDLHEGLDDQFVDQSSSELITTFESLAREALIPWALGIGDPIKDRMEALTESGN